MNKLIGFIMVLVVAALMAVPVSAQTSSEGDQEGITSPFQKTVLQNEFKVYEIAHQSAADIAELLPIQNVSINERFNTISLNVNTQVHEIVASIIAKYDVPKRTVEFQFFLVRANSSPNGGIKDDELPEKVRTALNELAGLTLYKNFELLAAPVILTREGSSAKIMGSSGDSRHNYAIDINGVGISGDANERQIRLNGFSAEFPTARIRTTLELTEGEMTIVGTTQIQDSAVSDSNSIIVIITAKIL